MFKGMRVRQLDSTSDDVTLRFRCSGDTDNNYDGFLGDATDAVVSLYENSSTGTVRKAEDRAKLRQTVTAALDRVFKDKR